MQLSIYAEREPFAGLPIEAPERPLPEFLNMEPGQSLPIDPSNPLSQMDEFHQRPLLARVYAGNDRFAVVAQRWNEIEERATGPYFLIREDLDAQPDDPVESVNFTNSRALVGHAWQGRPFHLGGTVDQEHFQVRQGKHGIYVTNYSLLSETILEQVEPRPSIGIKERLLRWASTTRERLGSLALTGADFIGLNAPMEIRAERADSRFRKFLDGMARLILEPDFTEPEPIETLVERKRRIAAAAAVGPAIVPDNPAPPVHRRKEWVAGNKSRFNGGVTDSVRGKDAGSDDSAPYGHFRDTRFPVIGRDSPTVRGGIYVSRGREALLMEAQSPQMQEAATEMKDIVWRMLNSGQPVSDRDILWEVHSYTRHRLPYSSDGSYDKLVQPLLSKSGIMPMSELLDRRYAICNGQAPFAVYLVESLIDAGLMFGRVSVERKIDKRSGIGHASLAFDPLGNTNPDNVLVSDLSGRSGFVGTRQEARDAGYWYEFDMPAAA